MNTYTKNRLIISGAICLIAVSLLAFMALGQKSSSMTVSKGVGFTIGASLGLSGALSSYGTWAKNGIEIAIENVRTWDEFRDIPIRLLIEDSTSTNRGTLSAYRALRAKGAQHVISLTSSDAMTLSSVVNADKVPHMSVSATTDAYSSPRDYTFRVGPLITDIIAKMSEVISQKYREARICVVAIDNEFGQGMLEQVLRMRLEQVVHFERFLPESVDFRSQLLRCKNADIDTMWAVAHGNEAGLLLRQLNELGMPLLFLSDAYSIETDEFYTLTKGLPLRVGYVAPKISNSELTERLRKSYLLLSKGELNFYVSQAHDAVIALAKGYLICQKLRERSQSECLHDVSFLGSSGAIFFDDNGDVLKELEFKFL